MLRPILESSWHSEYTFWFYALHLCRFLRKKLKQPSFCADDIVNYLYKSRMIQLRMNSFILLRESFRDKFKPYHIKYFLSLILLASAEIKVHRYAKEYVGLWKYSHRH